MSHINATATTVKMSTHARTIKQGSDLIPATLVRIDVLDHTGAFDYRFESYDPVAVRIKLEELGYGFVFVQ